MVSTVLDDVQSHTRVLITILHQRQLKSPVSWCNTREIRTRAYNWQHVLSSSSVIFYKGWKHQIHSQNSSCNSSLKSQIDSLSNGPLTVRRMGQLMIDSFPTVQLYYKLDFMVILDSH